MSRKIHSDKQGIYIIWDCRKWRPTGPSAHNKGEVATCYWTDYNTKDAVKVYGHQTLVDRNMLGVPAGIRRRDEIWTCTDTDPRIKKQLRSGFQKIEVAGTAGSMVTVVAGNDGYNYNQFRKDPTGYKPHLTKQSTRGMNVHLHIHRNSGHIQFNWDDWDAFVEEVNSHRDEVQVAPIAAKLQDEIDLEDELQEYIQEKGLA